jgi:hypothetical protein
MEIHEITKGSRRTDEGILDGIKKAVSAAKTGYNAVKTVGNTVAGVAKTGINKASAGYDKWADAEREKEHNKRQEKINRSVEKSTASLRRQGYDPNPHNLPLSAAGTKANIDAGTAGPKFKAKVALQKFMSQFVGPNMPAGGVANNPATTNTATTSPPASNPPASNQTAQPTTTPTKAAPKTKRTPAVNPAVPPGSRKRFKQMVNQFGKQPALEQPPRTTDDGGTVQATPTGIRHTSRKDNPNARKGRKKTTENINFLTEIYDIERDFPSWIDNEIPGLAAVRQNTAVAQLLDNGLKDLVAAKADPTALQSAFYKYYFIAANAVKDNPQGNTRDNGSTNSQFSYAQNDAIRNLKLDPKIITSLKQKLDNREITPNALIDYIKNYSAY